MSNHHHHLSKHELHEEFKQEAIAEFLGDEDEFHRSIHNEANRIHMKFVVFFVALFMVVLFSSFAVLAPVNSFVEGHLRSSVLDNNVVSFGDYSLYFTKNVSSLLSSLYVQNQLVNGVESAVCLNGEYLGSDNYIINGISYPKIYEQTRTHVVFTPCPDDTVVMLHTHPYKSCLASDVDLVTLDNAQKSNEHLLMIIMCESMRYSVYS